MEPSNAASLSRTNPTLGNRHYPCIIAPSLLASDFTRFGTETQRAARAGADWLHLDIMDGHFVPNISFGPDVVKRIRPLTKLFFDVHLMCSKPEILIEPFAKAGADSITIHVELGEAVMPLIWKIKAAGKMVGLAINPPTNINTVRPYLSHIDLVLVMTVNPGFGGQSFIHETMPKVQQVRSWRSELELNFRIEVDGGINPDTVRECALAGADTFVAGTALFAKRQMGSAITKMRKVVRSAAKN